MDEPRRLARPEDRKSPTEIPPNVGRTQPNCYKISNHLADASGGGNTSGLRLGETKVNGQSTGALPAEITVSFTVEKRGVTQDGLAALAGIASSYVSHIERGAHVPSLTIVLKLSMALEILPSDLLSDFTFPTMKRLKLNG